MPEREDMFLQMPMNVFTNYFYSYKAKLKESAR